MYRDMVQPRSIFAAQSINVELKEDKKRYDRRYAEREKTKT